MAHPVQAGMLREVEPTPDLQPDPLLLADLQEYMERFVQWPSPAHGLVLSTFVVHTWAIDAAFVTPYIYFTSSDPGAGKTKSMDVLSVVVKNADVGTDSPPHVLGQEIENNEPTLFFDEAETVFHSPNNGLKRVLNIGYSRTGGFIKRQRNNQVETWSVFCPKVLAGIKSTHMPESLLSRCIPVEMTPRTEEVERFNQFHQRRDPHRQELVDRVATFADTYMLDIANQRPEALRVLSDRENEIVEPLLAIAAVLGREDDLREALRQVFRRAGAPSREQAFLTKIREAFDAQTMLGGPADRIFTDTLLGSLGKMYTPRLLGILLAECGFIRTGKETFRIDTYTKRGYWRSDFEPLFARHLDPVGLHLAEKEEA